MEINLTAPDCSLAITPETDLVELVLATLPDLIDGDIIVLTSKIVSKAEGRLTNQSKAAALASETVRVVAQRNHTTIVQNNLGLIMAGAGIDDSNLPVGQLALLPTDPDHSAIQIREKLHLAGYNLGVLISDTCGRPWRNGQTDIAIGCAGIQPIHDYAGQTDPYGNQLKVTAPAIADEICAAAELVKTKLGNRPIARVRGLAELVLPVTDHGPGAAAIIRPADSDMFGIGSREAVLAALTGTDLAYFGTPSSVAELTNALIKLGLVVQQINETQCLVNSPISSELVTLANAYGWHPAVTDQNQVLLTAKVP